MTVGPEPLVDEHVLRRALRLDPDEVPPRLDPVLIAAAASAHGRDRSDIAVAVVIAFAGGWVSSEAFRALVGGLAAAMGIDPVATAIDLLTTVATAAAPVAAAATQPAVPIAIFAAAVVAALFERRGRPHAASS